LDALGVSYLYVFLVGDEVVILAELELDGFAAR
jgi:hypothetical protein